jgi:hypothetical protein
MPSFHASLAWGRSHGGALTRGERFRFTRDTVLATLAFETRRGLARLGIGDLRQIEIALSEIPLPDSPVARAAAALSAEVSSPALLAHNHRTYLWAALLGRRDGVQHDSELLFVSSLLHDLGLTAAHRPGPGVACFALAGAEAAERFLLAQGWPAPRAATAAEAIVRHLDPVVALAAGAEAHLLRQGAGLDVVGLRVSEIARSTREAVLSRHPRQGLRHELASTLAGEAQERPASRMAALCRLGFVGRVRRAPFPD